MLVGRWAQQAAVERNRRKLMRDTSIPDSVTLLEEDKPRPLSALKAGVRFAIKPGQSIPVACRLLSSQASVSLEWINGESEAQLRDEGQLLPSGALNIGSRGLEAEALEGWQDSTLRKLLEARRPGEFRDLKLERLLRWYLGIVVIIGIAGAVWWALHGAGVVQAVQVMISIFVVSCPCALGVAVPLAEELAAARAEKLGVFVRTLGLWKRLMRVQRTVFDKTGKQIENIPVPEGWTAMGWLTELTWRGAAERFPDEPWRRVLEARTLAVLLQDNLGHIVDFVCASGADPSLISLPAVIPPASSSPHPLHARISCLIFSDGCIGP